MNRQKRTSTTDKQHKTVALHGIKAPGGQASDEQLAAINEFTLEEMTAEQVYVRTFYLAHNGIDRDGEVFDDKLLEDFAKTLPGRGLFVKHPNSFDGDSGPGEGIWFEARVETMSLERARELLREPKLTFAPGTEQAKLLVASAYLAKTTENESLIQKIDAGIARYVSIGFRAADVQPINDGDTERTIAMRLLGPGEAYEASLVWLGAQPGAHAFKNANRKPNSDDDDEEKTMDIDEKELNRLKEADAALKALQSKHDGMLAGLRKALGIDDDKAEIDMKQLESLVTAGKQFREKLIDDIVSVERTAGLLDGDDDETVKAAKAEYADASTEKLVARAEKMKKLAKKGGGIEGSDPNATGAETDADKAARKSLDDRDMENPGENPLLHGKVAAA